MASRLYEETDEYLAAALSKLKTSVKELPHRDSIITSTHRRVVLSTVRLMVSLEDARSAFSAD